MVTVVLDNLAEGHSVAEIVQSYTTLTVDDIHAAVARTVQAGGEVIAGPTDNGWVVKAQIRDPAGNRLTLIQR